MTTVLCVSKPVSSPWNDSSKNLVRDLAQGVTASRLHLCGTGEIPFERDNVVWESVYKRSGQFAPGLAQNARMFARLMRPDRGIDIYHFFFAPNTRTSSALRAVNFVKRKRTVHTVCSIPKNLETVGRDLFADRVVAVSDWSADALRRAGVKNVHRVHPCIDPDRLQFKGPNPLAVELGVEGRPVVLFAGDIEVEGVVPLLAELAALLARRVPEARLVIAARAKIPESRVAAEELRQQLVASGAMKTTKILGEVARMDQLLALTSIAIFPVPSLYRKMDIPLVLLEALALEIPIVVSDLPPLREIFQLDCGLAVPFGHAEPLCEALRSILGDAGRLRRLGKAGRQVVVEHFSPGSMARAYEEIYRGLMHV